MASTNPAPSAGRGFEPGGMYTDFFLSFFLSLLSSLGTGGAPLPAFFPLFLGLGWCFVSPSRDGATSAHASRSLPVGAEVAPAAEGKSRASSDAALPLSNGVSTSCAVWEGETGP